MSAIVDENSEKRRHLSFEGVARSPNAGGLRSNYAELKAKLTSSSPYPHPGWSRLNFWLFACFLALVFLMGGGSRADVQSQPIVRLFAIIVLAIWVFQIRADDARKARHPLLFLAAAALAIGIQLVPLPPSVWADLPGRKLFADGLALADINLGWHPISLTPDNTLNSLLALLPPFAAAVGMAVLDRHRYPALVELLIGLILLSAVVAIIQISTSSLYLYRVTNEGSAVGLFANRNHQALLLAIAFPALACLATQPHADPNIMRLRNWLAAMVGVLIVPMLLVTGSRAGLLLGLLGGALAYAILLKSKNYSRRAVRASRRGLLALLATMAVAAMATMFLARDKALQRLLVGPEQTEARTRNLDTYLQMAMDYMPFGTGFGAFDPVYRIYERYEVLDRTYLNHAHNDWAQLAIEGGVIGMLLGVAFLVWFLLRSWRLWSERESATLGRTGSAIVLLILLASAVDYPLRTPIIATVAVIACFLMLPQGKRQERTPLSSLED